VAAAILAGAVVALSVVLATAPSTTVLLPAGAARSFRFVPGGGGAEIVALPPNGPPRASWVQIPANTPPGSIRVALPANAPPGGLRVQVPANAPPGGVRVQVPAIVLPAGGRAQAGRWVQVPARVWIQMPAGVVSPAPKASPTKTAH
jgi:hypothetical protein